MKSVYNKAKVKSWIKKAYKQHMLVYGHGFATDAASREPLIPAKEQLRRRMKK